MAIFYVYFPIRLSSFLAPDAMLPAAPELKRIQTNA